MQLPLPKPHAPLDISRPVLMGILNLTPDSFSDGGRWADPSRAIEQARAMVQQGAKIIDIGGESTRPGAQRISPEEQIARVCEVIAAVADELANGSTFNDHEPPAHRQAVISIDTTRSAVAREALQRGACIINDVSAGIEDPAILELAAEFSAPIVLMHMKGEPATMQTNPTYEDVVSEVEAFLMQRVEAAIKAGVPRDRIVIDPGIGFGKTREHNLRLMASLRRFVDTGYPVLLGASRKRFIGSILQRPDGNPPPPADLVAATCATTTLGVMAGVQMFRVHDVGDNFQAAEVADAVCRMQARNA